jgi:RNA polymerase sigma-70 factor (ECF subfamily)
MELIDECGPMVVGISWHILGNSADVEDNVQDVFLEACRIHERTPIRHGRGLLRRLATFGALAKLRRRRHHSPLEEVALVDPESPPENLAMRREMEQKLRNAVASLPEREGAVFSLRCFENLELSEIAECLGIRYSAAGAALSRARAKLAQVFAENLPENF